MSYFYTPGHEYDFELQGVRGSYGGDATHGPGWITQICWIALRNHPYYETQFLDRQVWILYRANPNGPAHLGFGLFLDLQACRRASTRFVERERDRCSPNEELVRELVAHTSP